MQQTRHQLMMLTMGRIIAPVIWGLTSLEVADHLTEGPLPPAELARRAGADEAALTRLLRCASAFGVFTELPDGRFASTDLSELLRADAEQSVRDLVLMNGTELFWRPYEAILHSARTGEAAFDTVFGMSLFEYLETRPDLAETFHRAMTSVSRAGVEAIAAAVDVKPQARVADIGGGRGFLLAELLARNPGCTGVLFDRPAAVEGAGPTFEERGVAGRVERVAGDFFGEVPKGCDTYLLKLVLHDWSDADAVRILRGVRTAMGEAADARLHVVEHVTGEPNTLDTARVLDIDMLVALGGRERSAWEYESLAAEAGLEPVGRRRATRFAVMEFAPL